LAERPVRKRAVSSSRSVSADAPKRKGFRVPPPAAPVVEEEPPTDNYALRLTEALEAISSAQSESESSLPRAAAAQPSARGRGSWLAALDKLPPIRLPIGPPIPWRLGLPVLVALVVLMGGMSRSSARADAPSVQLPAQQTYPVQSEAPLFTSSQQAEPPQPPAAQPLGLPDSSGPGFDLFDIAIKLAAVLGLAYGSLMLLKRGGFGGAPAAKTGGSPQAMRVVSSLALAPNRTVHVIKVPGGRTLLVGATPNAVNLIADLGEMAETDTPEAASFFDVLKARL
jgi:flagellar biogenesis protein FliO